MLKELLKNPEYIADWRSELSEFVSLMYHRVPNFKRDIERRLKDAVNSALLECFCAMVNSQNRLNHSKS